MCPLWPLHIVLIYLIALCPIWLVATQIVSKASKFGVSFTPNELQSLYMTQSQQVQVSTKELSEMELRDSIVRALISDPTIAYVTDEELVFNKDNSDLSDVWSSAFNVTGNFLGYTSVKLCVSDKTDKEKTCKKESEEMNITVMKKPRLVDYLFTLSVIILVSIIFINFGCALDVNSLKVAITRPIGPAIGLISHFLFLPLISFGLGKWLFPDSQTMRLGLFFTGISPAGGASNIWTYALGGNINLSVTMTAVSTLASFAMIPLWVFTLGPVIFSGGRIGVPYSRIITSAVGLVIPLVIGFAIQVWCKKLASIMVRILKPFSTLLIIFIVIFATATNTYLFKLFTWQIIVAGMSLPFLGYVGGYLLAKVLRQPPEDVMAISIETGVQNTGIAIFLLKFCLTQPNADLTTVVPVCIALMTPLPLLVLLISKKFCCKETGREKLTTSVDDKSPCLTNIHTSVKY